MGGKGRRPSPTKLKILRGEKRKDRIETGEPTPPPDTPRCPQVLDRIARAEWRRIVGDLRTLGLLSRIYRPSLAAYCQCYSRWHAATKTIEKEGMYRELKSGGLTSHPAVLIARDSSDSMRRWLMEFGLTPSALTRVKPIGGKQEEKKGLGQFLA